MSAEQPIVREHGNAYNLFILLLTVFSLVGDGPPGAPARPADAPAPVLLRQRGLRDLPAWTSPTTSPARGRSASTSSTSEAGSTCWARSRPSASSSSARCCGSPASAGWRGSPACCAATRARSSSATWSRTAASTRRSSRSSPRAPSCACRASSCSSSRAARPTPTSSPAATRCGGASSRSPPSGTATSIPSRASAGWSACWSCSAAWGSSARWPASWRVYLVPPPKPEETEEPAPSAAPRGHRCDPRRARGAADRSRLAPDGTGRSAAGHSEPELSARPGAIAHDGRA